MLCIIASIFLFFFFFNDTATTESYTSLFPYTTLFRSYDAPAGAARRSGAGAAAAEHRKLPARSRLDLLFRLGFDHSARRRGAVGRVHGRKPHTLRLGEFHRGRPHRSVRTRRLSRRHRAAPPPRARRPNGRRGHSGWPSRRLGIGRVSDARAHRRRPAGTRTTER